VKAEEAVQAAQVKWLADAADAMSVSFRVIFFSVHKATL
jgi:hypothetical protein